MRRFMDLCASARVYADLYRFMRQFCDLCVFTGVAGARSGYRMKKG